MFPNWSDAIPKGNASGSKTGTLSNVSRTVSNLVIVGPVCSETQRFPLLSKNSAVGSFRESCGPNSLDRPVSGLMTPIFPAVDSVNQMFPNLPKISAVGPEKGAAEILNSSNFFHPDYTLTKCSCLQVQPRYYFSNQLL